jgi:hypothetical protein
VGVRVNWFGVGVWFLSTFIIGDEMNKIDLIIDALSDCAGWGYKDDEKIDKALATAIDLKAELAELKLEWQELYKDEVYAILNDGEEWSSLEFAQAISDLLREKNT